MVTTRWTWKKMKEKKTRKIPWTSKKWKWEVSTWMENICKKMSNNNITKKKTIMLDSDLSE